MMMIIKLIITIMIKSKIIDKMQIQGCNQEIDVAMRTIIMMMMVRMLRIVMMIKGKSTHDQKQKN